MNRTARGQVLVQVLIMSILMLLLATLLMRMVLQQAQLQEKVVTGSQTESQYNDAVVRVVHDAWSITGYKCPDYTAASGSTTVSCSPPDQFACNCICTVRINGVSYPSATLSSYGGGKWCKIVVNQTYH